MWLLLLGLSLLAGDVLSQALNLIDSETDLLASSSDQLIHSSAELDAVEDRFSELPFGARLPGYEQPLFAYSYTVGTDDHSTKPVTVQKFGAQQRRENPEPTGTKPTESTKNVIYLSNFNLPKKATTNADENSSLEKNQSKVSSRFSTKHEEDSGEEALAIKEYLPPKEEINPPRELSEYLPPKEEIIPPRELSEYLPPKEEIIPPRELSGYLPPKEEIIPPRELSEYLPPKEEINPPRELSEYLPPKEEIIPPREISEYLPPKEEINPLREISEYSPQNEISTLSELKTDNVLPSTVFENIRELSEYFPPKQSSKTTPLQPTKVSGVFTRHPDSSISLFVQENPKTKLQTSENRKEVHSSDRAQLQQLVPPVQNYQFPTETKISPTVFHPTLNNEPVIARTETVKQEPYALVHESSDFPIQAKAEKPKIDPYSIEGEQKNKIIKQKKYENPLSVGIPDNAIYFPPNSAYHSHSQLKEPVSLFKEETPSLIPTFITSKISPDTLPNKSRYNPIVAKAEAPNIDPYGLVQEVKEIPIKAASERNKVDPYAIVPDNNLKIPYQRYENCYVCSLGNKEQSRKEPSRIKVESFEKPRFPSRVHSKVTSAQPYSVVADKVDNKIIPSRSESNRLPYAVIDEYKTASLRPYQYKQRVNPLGVDSRIMNRPIVPQSVKATVPLPAVGSSEQSIRPPLTVYPNLSYGLVGENNYGCLSNDECNQNEICEHGKCILACTIAKYLCIGDARCETRHHVAACVCPLMSTARTVTRAGNVQFDCMAMVMPADNVIQRTQTNSVNRYKASSCKIPHNYKTLHDYCTVICIGN